MNILVFGGTRYMGRHLVNVLLSNGHKVTIATRSITPDDFEYDEVKRQAECAIVQKYANVPSAIIRFPFAIGTDDYTKRGNFLLFLLTIISQEQ